MSRRRWTDEDLGNAVAASRSLRQVLIRLGLVPAGGNYHQVSERMNDLGFDSGHFLGKGWNKDWQFDPREPKKPLSDILVKNRTFQSHHLKMRLFRENIKTPRCELCGWAQQSPDGRIPVELDHINGVHSDNRLENLRILCPNCHSLQPTHRGRNKKKRYARVS